MALKHAQWLDVIDLPTTHDDRSEASEHGGAFSRSLIKTDHFQLIQLVLGAGEHMHEHHVAGEITIQCLAGEVSVVTPQRTCELKKEQMLALPAGEPHAVHAHSNATLLVTLLRTACAHT